MTKIKDDWIYRWKNWIKPTRTRGLYRIRDGGFIFRRMVTDPTTGKEREIKRVLRDANEATAALEMQRAVLERKSGAMQQDRHPRKRLAEFAVQLFEEKRLNELRSAATVVRWRDTLKHLLSGTTGKSGKRVAGLGEVYIHMLEQPIREWRTAIAGLIAAGDYAPTTCNSWLSILRVITKALTFEHNLPYDPCMKIKKFDESEHATYTEEEPNALPPERAKEFLDLMFQHFPQHYAMTYLGFVTGLRPSSLRPLRRRGPEADIKWDVGKLVVRRSHSIGGRVMQTTRQRRRYAIHLPDVVMQTLEWHVKTQLRRPEQRASELLFPSAVGGFRARSVLDKPFAEVAEMMGLTFKVTPRAMRRTFNDMARLANIESVVTRSISGHRTERMQEHYSTVQNTEQREALTQLSRVLVPENTEWTFDASTDLPALDAASALPERQLCASLCAPDASLCAPEPSSCAPTEPIAKTDD